MADGERYKRAKYGDDDDDDAPERASARGETGGSATPRGLKALARSTNDVPPNFNLLVVFALGLLRALLRKMSGKRRPRHSGPGPGTRPFPFLLRFRISRRARTSGLVE
jgi:hypothetical protein